MVDPFAEVVSLLQPAARLSKHVLGAGSWALHRSDAGQPFYCAVLEGSCRLALDRDETTELKAGDFVLIPANFGFTMSSLQPWSDVDSVPTALGEGVFRIGEQDGPIDLRLLVGHCRFGSPDGALLVSLLPQMIHVRDEQRLTTLVQWISEESREDRAARDEVLARLLEVLLIEALRSNAGANASPGLVRALADPRLAQAVRSIHQDPSRAWTVRELANEAALSRSAFFSRFQWATGVTPMDYLLTWRMALAKKMLRQEGASVAAVAQLVGYGSASAFSAAFARHVGVAPAHYSRGKREADLSHDVAAFADDRAAS